MTVSVDLYRYYPPKLPRREAVRDDEILSLWSAGRDTYAIALQLGVPESEVANRLPRILENRRANAEWKNDALLLRSAR